MTIEDFKFNFKKYCAREAIALLLNFYLDKRISYKLVLNTLYLADKVNIKNYGFPVVGGKYVCTDYGIVAEQLFLELKTKKGKSLIFGSIKLTNKGIFDIKVYPGFGNLCVASEKSLRLASQLVKQNQTKYQYPAEWINPQDKEYVEFDNSVLLKQCGYSDEDIALVKEEEEYHYYVDKTLALKKIYS